MFYFEPLYEENQFEVRNLHEYLKFQSMSNSSVPTNKAPIGAKQCFENNFFDTSILKQCKYQLMLIIGHTVNIKQWFANHMS